MITIVKMKAKPTVSQQSIVDDMLAGKVVELPKADAPQSFDLELKLTGSIEEIRSIVDFIKKQAVTPQTQI